MNHQISPKPSKKNNGSLTSLWYDADSRAKIIQTLVLVLLIGGFSYLIHNAYVNLETQNKEFDFAFLTQPAGYEINQKPIEYNNSTSTHFRAMVVGIVNTLIVAVCSIILASALGFLLGVMRLSKNWLINKIAYWYIEYIRNVPVLIHIYIVYSIFQVSLPNIRKVIDPENNSWLTNVFQDFGFYLTNRGLLMPAPQTQPLFYIVLTLFVAGLIFAWWFNRHAKRVQNETGKHYPVFWINLFAIIGAPILVYFLLGSPIDWQKPEFGRFNFKGGITIIPEFIALWVGLSLYSAAFIGEIVRAGIKAVNWGQTEAASALGLSAGRTLSLVVIPQAMRVITPSLTNQYLNITKNSSLAAAIGYMEIMGTIGGPTMTNTGREMETMMLILLIYLVISLIISALMNWYNKRIKLTER